MEYNDTISSSNMCTSSGATLSVQELHSTMAFPALWSDWGVLFSIQYLIRRVFLYPFKGLQQSID